MLQNKHRNTDQRLTINKWSENNVIIGILITEMSSDRD